MKDIFGNQLKIGDTIIVTVSKGSLYLTTAEILDYDEISGKAFITYASTPKEKWINLSSEPCMLYPAPLRELYSETGLFKDNSGIKVSPGDVVAWKNGETISIGKLESIDSELWGRLEDGVRVRNVQILKLAV